jgi:TM2 domain-containing membrane protein YozV
MLSNLERKAKLETGQLILLESELRKHSKNMFGAYALWHFLWSFGAHRFYLGRKKTAIGQLLIGIVMFIALIIFYAQMIASGLLESSNVNDDITQGALVALAVFGICFIGGGIWAIVDAFIIYKWVRAHNEKVESDLLEQFGV